MAASNYLLELDQRRERLISDVVTQLVRVPKGSVEHEIAVAFTARSLAYHGQLDAEAKKVIQSVVQRQHRSRQLEYTAIATATIVSHEGVCSLFGNSLTDAHSAKVKNILVKYVRIVVRPPLRRQNT